MQITKEQIQARAAVLQKTAEKLQNDLNATLGALQDCNYWLAQLDVTESTANSIGGLANETQKT